MLSPAHLGATLLPHPVLKDGSVQCPFMAKFSLGNSATKLTTRAAAVSQLRAVPQWRHTLFFTSASFPVLGSENHCLIFRCGKLDEQLKHGVAEETASQRLVPRPISKFHQPTPELGEQFQVYPFSISFVPSPPHFNCPCFFYMGCHKPSKGPPLVFLENPPLAFPLTELTHIVSKPPAYT